MPDGLESDLTDADYTRRLQVRSGATWKRLLGAQVPYRRHIRRAAVGRTLDVGCGIGRNLAHLGGRAVGVDINSHSVQAARRAGHQAYTPGELASSGAASPSGFDTLLFSHVLEHMTLEEAANLVREYLTYLKRGGRVLIIVPQAAGFRSDPTHVSPVGNEELARIAEVNQLNLESVYSFPFPRWFGGIFRHNETVAHLGKA